jgi:hypothetical protein
MHKKSRKSNKTLRLDTALLDEAKKVLGYQTYTETIEQTLKLALNNARHQNILNQYQGKLKSFKSLYE